MPAYILMAVVSYLVCSFSFAIVLSRLSGDDVREHGSGNAGATNMARVYGLGHGILTLVGDMLKCIVVMVLSGHFGGDLGLAASGMACLIGHCFPVFYKFKGGKGVSVGAAIALVLDWRMFLICLVAFALVAVLTRKVSLSSCAAAVSLPVASLLLSSPKPIVVMCILGATLVVFRHRENLRRVLNGTEPDFKPAAKRGKKATEKTAQK